MATRRPRVPKSARRQLADVGAAGARAPGPAGPTATPRPGHDTATGHRVGGHSAKVIPLDAAPSRHAPAVPPPVRRLEHAERAVPGGDVEPAEPVGPVEQDRPTSSADAAATAQSSGRSRPVRRRRRRTPEERRAAARQKLLRRARSGGTPAASRPTAPQARSSTVQPVPARNFTGRSVALLIVLFVAAVLLAPTLRVYLDQQGELRTVQEEIAEQQAEQQELTAQIARWDDPAYIKQQARDRFNLVMPGEKTYMVIGGDETVEDPVPPPASPSEVNPDMPWADALWDSVVRAGTD